MQTDFDSFKQWLTDHDYADLTTQSYLGSLKLFATWFEKENGEELSPSKLTPTDLRNYREHLSRKQHRAPATVNRQLAGLGTYCKWAVKEHLIEANPSANIHGLSKTRLAPHWLERKQRFALQRVIEREWQQTSQMSTRRSVWRRRDLCIVMSLLHLGLRVAELTGITLPDITLGERSGKLEVHGKGARERTLPINVEARKYLREWLDIRPDVSSESLFVSQLGETLTTRSVQRLVADIGHLAKIAELTPHVLRHTFAKKLAENKVSIDRIATLLGHSSVDTTRIYVLPSLNDLAQDVEGLVDQ